MVVPEPVAAWRFGVSGLGFRADQSSARAIASASGPPISWGQALVQGYLAMDEYENRLQAIFAAHTTAELHRLVADLPLDRIRRNDPRRRGAGAGPLAAVFRPMSPPTWAASC